MTVTRRTASLIVVALLLAGLALCMLFMARHADNALAWWLGVYAAGELGVRVARLEAWIADQRR